MYDVTDKYLDDSIEAGKCPECGEEALAVQGGCITCLACGWSVCG